MERKREKAWNEEFWGKAQTKAIQGICAIIIILHHMSQKTSASWVPDEFRVHGLEPFVSLGFLMVGVFFFCSGYGLYRSLKAKEDYLNGFIGKHFRPIILIYIIANAVYYLVGNVYSGYNWYIYAILYLYMAFYVSFGFIKKEAASIGVLAGFIALYMAVCDLLVVGTWCYNTVGVFFAGLMFAKYCDRIVGFIRRKYIACLITCAVILVAAFAGAEILTGVVGEMTETVPYNAARFGALAAQLVASTAFPVLLFIVSQKVRIGGKALEFLGSMTLELYMIHVLYVEMFGYCFSNLENGDVCYIRSVWLYVPVVLALSVASAYAMTWVRKGAKYIYDKYPEIFAAIRKDAKKVLIGILITIAVVTVITTVRGIAEKPKLVDKAEQYSDKNITYVNVGGVNIALYVAGEGDEAVMLLRGDYDACPSLTQKGLADELAKDFRVVVVDLPGSGFSDDSVSERTAENICAELHEIAESLHLAGFTIMTENTSNIYAMYYVNKYPGEVGTVVTLDGETVEMGRAMLDFERIPIPEYRRQLVKSANMDCALSWTLNCFGYRSMVWPIYKEMFLNSLKFEEFDVAYYKFFDRHDSGPIRNERYHEIDNYLAIEGMKYPADVKVIDFVSEGRRKSFEKRGIDAEEYLARLCPNPGNHKVVAVTDCMYCVLANPGVFRKNMVEE